MPKEKHHRATTSGKVGDVSGRIVRGRSGRRRDDRKDETEPKRKKRKKERKGGNRKQSHASTSEARDASPTVEGEDDNSQFRDENSPQRDSSDCGGASLGTPPAESREDQNHPASSGTPRRQRQRSRPRRRRRACDGEGSKRKTRSRRERKKKDSKECPLTDALEHGKSRSPTLEGDDEDVEHDSAANTSNPQGAMHVVMDGFDESIRPKLMREEAKEESNIQDDDGERKEDNEVDEEEYVQSAQRTKDTAGEKFDNLETVNIEKTVSLTLGQSEAESLAHTQRLDKETITSMTVVTNRMVKDLDATDKRPFTNGAASKSAAALANGEEEAHDENADAILGAFLQGVVVKNSGKDIVSNESVQSADASPDNKSSVANRLRTGRDASRSPKPRKERKRRRRHRRRRNRSYDSVVSPSPATTRETKATRRAVDDSINLSPEVDASVVAPQSAESSLGERLDHALDPPRPSPEVDVHGPEPSVEVDVPRGKHKRLIRATKATAAWLLAHATTFGLEDDNEVVDSTSSWSSSDSEGALMDSDMPPAARMMHLPKLPPLPLFAIERDYQPPYFAAQIVLQEVVSTGHLQHDSKESHEPTPPASPLACELELEQTLPVCESEPRERIAHGVNGAPLLGGTESVLAGKPARDQPTSAGGCVVARQESSSSLSTKSCDSSGEPSENKVVGSTQKGSRFGAAAAALSGRKLSASGGHMAPAHKSARAQSSSSSTSSSSSSSVPQPSGATAVSSVTTSLHAIGSVAAVAVASDASLMKRPALPKQPNDMFVVLGPPAMPNVKAPAGATASNAALAGIRRSQPLGRVCAKMMVRSHMRCGCHFALLRDCPKPKG